MCSLHSTKTVLTFNTAMRGETIVDGRNIFDKPEVIAAGFRYFGIGK